jgi:hypothetical protein
MPTISSGAPRAGVPQTWSQADTGEVLTPDNHPLGNGPKERPLQKLGTPKRPTNDPKETLGPNGTRHPPKLQVVRPPNPPNGPMNPEPLTPGSPNTTPYTPQVAPWSLLPPPSVTQSAPPEGTGLTKGSDFGPDSVKTAGGWTIVPDGTNKSWSVYGPDQKPGDTPVTHVHGDPHVDESDGTKWDFSSNSSFRLPDGTQINVTTSEQEGHSFTDALDITNGNDHVKISGIKDDAPQTSEVTHDGYDFRAAQAKEDTYTLGGDKDHVQWFKQDSSGKLLGEVTGSDFNGSYTQQTSSDTQYVVDPSLRPPTGSAAWGNLLHDQAIDAASGINNLNEAWAKPTTAGATPTTSTAPTTVTRSSNGVTGGPVSESQGVTGAPQPGVQKLDQDIDSIMKLFKLWSSTRTGRSFGSFT